MARTDPERTPPGSWADRHIWQLRPVRDLFWLALGLFVLWIGYVLRSIFTPVLIALALAYLFSPLIDYAERRWRMSRTVALSLLMGGLALIAAGFIAWLGPIVVEQAISLIRRSPEYARTLAQRYELDLAGYDEQLNELANQVKDRPTTLLKPLFTGTSQALGFIGNVISVTVYIAITVFLIPIYFFFFTLHFPPMLRELKTYIPESRRERTLDILAQMDRAVSSFFRGRVIIGLIMAAMLAIGWCPLVTDVPYWLLLALLTGALSLIPYAAGVGWLLVLLLKAVDLFATGDAGVSDWVIGLGGPTLVYVIVQLIESWLLTPLLQGRALGLNAVTVLIVVFVGGALGGLFGLLVAIPLAACGRILLREIVIPYYARWARSH